MIGRWQPFHDGHKALVQKVLDEGKSVLIAIRSTETNEDNPYNIPDRIMMIKEAFPQDEVVVMPIPDIEEVVVGRKVGYGIRHIKLEDELEAISGTKTRKELRKIGALS